MYVLSLECYVYLLSFIFSPWKLWYRLFLIIQVELPLIVVYPNYKYSAIIMGYWSRVSRSKYVGMELRACVMQLYVSTLRMATWVAETCWWLLCNKITFINQVHFLVCLKSIRACNYWCRQDSFNVCGCNFAILIEHCTVTPCLDDCEFIHTPLVLRSSAFNLRMYL